MPHYNWLTCLHFHIIIFMQKHLKIVINHIKNVLGGAFVRNTTRYFAWKSNLPFQNKKCDEKKSAAVEVAAGPFCQYIRICCWLKQLCLLKMQLFYFFFFFGVINHLLWRSHSTPSDANLHSIVAKNSKIYKRIKNLWRMNLRRAKK